MKKLTKTLVASSLLASAVTAHAVEVSGNVALTTDYRFRGISQTSNQFAIQGGFDIDLGGGLYVGTWASNVNFSDGIDFGIDGDDEVGAATDFANTDGEGDDNDAGDGSVTSTEIDYYIGYSFDLAEDLNLDLSFVLFDYQQSREFDYEEYVANLSYKDFTLGFVFADDFFGTDQEYYYISTDYSLGLPEDFALNLHFGVTISPDNDGPDGDGGFVDGLGIGDDETVYLDWQVSISKDVAGVTLDLAYNDTDIDDDAALGDGFSDATVIFTVSKSL